MDEATSAAIKPKLDALMTFTRNVESAGHYFPDDETRAEYRRMYDDIAQTLNDPELEIFAPPLPHLGTMGQNAKLLPEHNVRIVASATRLISYIEAQRAQVRASREGSERPLRCFLSYRFDPQGERYATEVGKFLQLVGVEVVTGERYEPRSLSDKISEILTRDLHFGVLIVSGEGESMWTRDEANRLWSENKYVIVLVEEGASFNQGLQADLEWIPFAKDHIADAFTKLMEGIRFIQTRLD